MPLGESLETVTYLYRRLLRFFARRTRSLLVYLFVPFDITLVAGLCRQSSARCRIHSGLAHQ
jgi:hypothetical protein